MMHMSGTQKGFPINIPMEMSWLDTRYPARVVVVWNSFAMGMMATAKLLLFTSPSHAKKQTVKYVEYFSNGDQLRGSFGSLEG